MRIILLAAVLFWSILPTTDGVVESISPQGNTQLYTVPANVYSMLVTCIGAQGQSDGSNVGGKGAKVVVLLDDVSPGMLFHMEIGKQNGYGGYV